MRRIVSGKSREMMMSLVLIAVSCSSILFLCCTSRNLARLATSIAQSLNIEQSIPAGLEEDEPIFPRKLHYLWPNKNFTFGDEDPDGIEQRQTLELVERIRQNNPGWTIRIWTDDECYSLVREHFPDFYQHWTSLKPQLKMWDAVRPMILHIHGGIYLDHDIECDEGVQFSKWISPATTLLLREPSPGIRGVLGNHFMGSSPKHPIWKLYLENIIKDTPSNPSVTRHTGPGQLYPTFQDYVKDLTDRSHIRLLALNEMSNSAECKQADGKGETYCSQPRCRHKHFVSPAELAGEDDNANGQINGFRKKVGLPPLKATSVTCTCRRLAKYLNESNPVVFVHIPKVGGTTIESLMGYRGSCHATAAEMRACRPKDYEKALSFTALRHPIERVISVYRYAQKGGNGSRGDEKKFGWVNGTSFSDFVKALPTRQEVNFASQTHFIVDPEHPSPLLVDEVICTENLEAGWDKLTALAPSLKKYGSFPKQRQRVSPARIPKLEANQIDATTQQLLRDMYRNDFVLWEKYCGNNETQ